MSSHADLNVAPGSLAELAALYGVQTAYTDIQGQTQNADPLLLLKVLESLGAPVRHLNDVADACRFKKEQQAQQVLEPVWVAWDGELSFSVQLPRGFDTGSYAVSVQQESGATQKVNGLLQDLPVVASTTFGPVTYVRKTIRVLQRLEAGYHQLIFDTPKQRHTALVISAPKTAYSPRDRVDLPEKMWGMFAPVYALHSEARGTMGDLAELERLMAWTEKQGGHVVGTLPLLASFLQEPLCEPSPYVPASRLFWNEMFLDVTRIAEWADVPEARVLYSSAAFRAATNRKHPWVNYREPMAHKRKILACLADAFFKNSTNTAFENFVKSTSAVDDYAQFRAATEKLNNVWQKWPEHARSGYLSAHDYNENDRRYHLYVQWQMSQQLSALADKAKQRGLGLYLDVPVGVHPASYDLWRHPNNFLPNISAGAPPDALFVGGQNWGFPPLAPESIRADRYRYVIQMFQNQFRYAGVVRIDHVMGLYRMYCVPEGASAKDGIYVRYHADELFALLVLESHRTQTILIGEDLGTVPDPVREAMNQHYLHRMFVGQFEFSATQTHVLNPAPKNAVASMNTHDTPTFRGFWEGHDIPLRLQLGHIDAVTAEQETQARAQLRQQVSTKLQQRGLLPQASTEPDFVTVYQQLVQILAHSDAFLVLLNLEDLCGETRPQNVPGTLDEHPNWRGRCRWSLEELENDQTHQALFAELAHRSNPRESPTPTAKATRPVSSNMLSSTERGAVLFDAGFITPDDVYFFNEGTHTRLYEKLGAHLIQHNGQKGCHFCVWAPNAKAVSVLGDFNSWRTGVHFLAPIGHSGLWQGFLPRLTKDTLYKFGICTREGHWLEKADPVAFAHEGSPGTASKIADLAYVWHDDDWMGSRTNFAQPMSTQRVQKILRVAPTEFVENIDEPDLYAQQLIMRVTQAGCSHVELPPMCLSPNQEAPLSFFAILQPWAPTQLMRVIDRLHQQKIGVVFEWDIRCFSRVAQGLSNFDGTCLYEHMDPRQGLTPDAQAAVFNYSRFEVRAYLLSNALFWLDQFHADAIRVMSSRQLCYLDVDRAPGNWVPNRNGGRENLDAMSLLEHLGFAMQKYFKGTQLYKDVET